jgi:hypothetical protein
MFLKVGLVFFSNGNLMFKEIQCVCVCGFTEKNIDVYPFYKHSKVSKKILYGCCLL